MKKHRHTYRNAGIIRFLKYKTCTKCDAVTTKPRWPFWKRIK